MKTKTFIMVVLFILFLYGAVSSTISDFFVAQVVDTVFAVLAFFGLVFTAIFTRRKGDKWYNRIMWTFILLGVTFPIYANDAMVNVTLSSGLPELIAAGIIGILLHVISKVRDLFTGKKITWEAFKSEPNWGGHILYGLFAALVVVFAVISKESLSEIYPLTIFSTGLLGYGVDSIFKNWTKFSGKQNVPVGN